MGETSAVSGAAGQADHGFGSATARRSGGVICLVAALLIAVPTPAAGADLAQPGAFRGFLARRSRTVSSVCAARGMRSGVANPRTLRRLLMGGTAALLLAALQPWHYADHVQQIERYQAEHPATTATIEVQRSRGASPEHAWVPLQEMSPVVARMLVAAEDARYCFHGGVDRSALWYQVKRAAGGDKPGGASTIPMQVVGMLLFGRGGDTAGRGPRKFWEVVLAPKLVESWGPDHVLNVYANTVQAGPVHFGMEAAAQSIFGVSARDLTREQALALAGRLPHPKRPAGAARLESIDGSEKYMRANDWFGCLSEDLR